MAFEYRYDLSGNSNPAIIDWPVGTSQTITKGMVLNVSSGLAVVGGGGSTTILGVAMSAKTTGGSVTSADTVEVLIPGPRTVFEVGYTGSSKTSLTDADLTTAFDIASGAVTIDLDDTTGATCRVIKYDNTADTAHILFDRTSLAFN